MKIVGVTGFCGLWASKWAYGIVGVTGFCGLWALKWAWQIGRHRFSRFVNVKMGVANFFRLSGRGKLFWIIR